ncbi:MAG: hypothetical protein J7J31_08395 [Helicobacteraceae bacterium]|nr:hypothetical protein [Helicobacteraceae bacterium]
MRSRDGNSSLSLFICGVILFNSFSLYADEYLISYRYVLQDARLYNESLSISRAMKKCEGEKLKSFTLDYDKTKGFKENILKKSEDFLMYLHKLGLHVEHREHVRNFTTSSQTILTLKTMCFKVDFNDNLAIITPLK